MNAMPKSKTDFHKLSRMDQAHKALKYGQYMQSTRSRDQRNLVKDTLPYSWVIPGVGITEYHVITDDIK